MIARTTGFLKKWPLHVLLLPLFFIASAYTQYAGLLFREESLSIALLVYAGLALAFGIFFLLYKNMSKAAIASTLGGIIYLFFGNLKELLRNNELLVFISHYKTLVPLLLILLGYMLIRLHKVKSPYYLNLFLNFLLIIYLGIEAWKFTRLLNEEPKPTSQASIPLVTDSSSSQRPNIYYLLFDCYPGSGYQRDMLGIDSNDLDKFLSEKGFYVVNESKSNYHMTSFSMASLFNMEYLDWLNGVEKLRPYHYNNTVHLVKNAKAFQWLSQYGYELNNLSIFDMPGKPSIKREQFLSTTGREIILYNTFFKCLYRDVFPEVFPSVKSGRINDIRSTRKEQLQAFREYNEVILDSLKSLSTFGGNRPQFVYAHLELPHFPYFYDSTGREYADDLVFGKEIITNKHRFKNYIGYTNQQIMALLNSLLSRSNGRDIIILQSDHGINDLNVTRKQDAFRNYTAIYYPDRDYRMLYGGMSNVNGFRILFNKYFGQQLPLLKDSCIYIK